MIGLAPLWVARHVDFVGHHTLREQGGEGFVAFGGQVAGRVHRPRKETGIEQVQNGVFDSADILVDIHPVFCFGHIGWRLRGSVATWGVAPTGCRGDRSAHLRAVGWAGFPPFRGRPRTEDNAPPEWGIPSSVAARYPNRAGGNG